MNEFFSAEIVKDKTGRQYHIGLAPDEISGNIILVGDPDRLEKFKKFFSSIKISKHNREFNSITGEYKGSEITVLSTGIGCDNTEIAVIELCQLKFPLTIIRCGTCGALQKEINIGDLIISSGALRLENTSLFFVENSYPAISSYEVNLALMKSAIINNIPFHYGITATASGFYGAQGRNVPGFPLKDEKIIDRLVIQGIKNLEMETSCLLTLASLRGFRAGSVCVVFANRQENKFIDPDEKYEAELRAISTSMEAFEFLSRIDRQKKGQNYWIPEI